MYNYTSVYMGSGPSKSTTPSQVRRDEIVNSPGFVAQLADNPGIDRKINRALDRMPGGDFKGVPRGGDVPLRYRESDLNSFIKELNFCPLGAENDGKSYRIRGLVLTGEHKGHEITITGTVRGRVAEVTFGAKIHEGEIHWLYRDSWWTRWFAVRMMD